MNPLTSNVPVRLCEETRALSRDYLTGIFWKRNKPAVFHYSPSAPGMSPFRVRSANALLTARKAPLEIIPEERLAGAAPFLEAVHHQVPGLTDTSSISHTTVDFGNAVTLGLSGLQRDVEQRLQTVETDSQRQFCEGLLEVIQAMRVWIARYREAYTAMLESSDYTPAQKANFQTIRDTIAAVPENPPKTFREAIQSFWSFFEFQRLCGNWSGLGRFDLILGDYLSRDLAEGIITLDEARELVAHFWIKGTEWAHGLQSLNHVAPASGDAQTYQNIILGGIAPDGHDVENEVTYLVLDVVEELHISDYPIAVRLNSRTSEKLLRRVAEVQLLGGGIVSVYNEDIVIDGLLRFGYPEEEARAFTNDGCWEVIIPGKTNFGYCARDILQALQKTLFERPPTARTFEEFYGQFFEDLRESIEDGMNWFVSNLYQGATLYSPQDVDYPEAEGEDVVLSLLEPSCRESAKSYQGMGTKYIVRSPHANGLPDVANSLRAIDEFVFRRKECSLAELVEILRNDWQGHETLRQKMHKDIFYYGNDDDDADAMVKRVHEDYAAIVMKHHSFKKLLMPPGISTFGREIAFAPARLATAFGAKAHEYLAPNLSPTPGTDRSPITAVLKSYCKMDLARTPNGCPLDLRLNATRNQPNAPELLVALLKTFVSEGGFYLQLDVVDPDMLRQAQKEPDRFPNLVVRISGWSARFATLSKEWQDMIINRTALEF